MIHSWPLLCLLFFVPVLGLVAIITLIGRDLYSTHVSNLISRGETTPGEMRVKGYKGGWAVQVKANGVWLYQMLPVFGDIVREYRTRAEAEEAGRKLIYTPL